MCGKFSNLLTIDLIIYGSIAIKHAHTDNIIGKVVNTDTVGIAYKGTVTDIIYFVLSNIRRVFTLT